MRCEYIVLANNPTLLFSVCDGVYVFRGSMMYTIATYVSEFVKASTQVPTMSCFRCMCVLLIALCSGAFAQTATSVIFGTVTDASGSAVPNLPLTATAGGTRGSPGVANQESRD